jgi:hypothetical protein
VHLVTDVLTAGSDWSPAAFTPYAEERKERMRRLRFTCAAVYRMNTFGAEARERRGRLLQFFLSNPLASPVATMLLGAWALPEEAYSDTAWDVLAGV